MSQSFPTAILLTLCLLAIPAAAQSGPGIAKEKPESGPFVQIEGGYMVPYTYTIPGTDISFEMVPVPGGEFLMGSPEGEADRGEDEGPQFRVKVDPMWVGKHEVTWDSYKYFMELYRSFKAFQKDDLRNVSEANRADAITTPTPLYDPEKTFERGQAPKQPAVTMSPLAARQYTKWLSLLSGDFYRLPSEAEWEYAARAGTKTAYSFGDNADDIDEYGWYFENAIDEDLDLETYKVVGQKKPNAFGLHDMHGNVSELVLDGYAEDHYQKFEGKTVHWSEALNWPKERGPRVHRGGNFDNDPDRLRSAARGTTDEKEWKIQDPNLPKSPWWYTEVEARGVGMRIVRPLQAPATAAEKLKFWEDSAEEVLADVDLRLREGRGVLGLIDPDLPKALKSAGQSGR